MSKEKELKKYKWFATGLFLLMTICFIVFSILEKNHSQDWAYARAFSEAAMVGALADWFAVTALFRHPFGIKIPHTNLIEKSKSKIGNNLGGFVVENFLSPEKIRPYLSKIKVAELLGKWLSEEKNQKILVKEISWIIWDILDKIEDKLATEFIAKKIKEVSNGFKMNSLLGSGLEYVIQKQGYQQLMNYILSEVKKALQNNSQMIRERVQKESYFFVPEFLDHKIADKITAGIIQYFVEVEENPNHLLRQEIGGKLITFAHKLKTEIKWERELEEVKKALLDENKISEYSSDIWQTIRKNLLEEISAENSVSKNYVYKKLSEWASDLHKDNDLQMKIDHWARATAEEYILKNTHHFGELIRSTVGNWEGRELSQKLELEVGRDLQFIRVNGTVVGGIVGLIIYTLSRFFI